jgi:predicted transcriptional regulator
VAQAKATVVLRVDDLRSFMAAAGIETNRELARRMGTVSESYVSRLMSGEIAPNLQTMFGFRRVFPLLDPERLFELVEEIEQGEEVDAA